MLSSTPYKQQTEDKFEERQTKRNKNKSHAAGKSRLKNTRFNRKKQGKYEENKKRKREKRPHK